MHDVQPVVCDLGTAQVGEPLLFKAKNRMTSRTEWLKCAKRRRTSPPNWSANDIQDSIDDIDGLLTDYIALLQYGTPGEPDKIELAAHEATRPRY